MTYWQYLILILATAAVTAGRFFIPTVGHSWPMVLIAFSHIFVGVMLTLLWLKRGNWPAGWWCLGIPTLLEALMFFAHNG
jgi:hypothetical protein